MMRFLEQEEPRVASSGVELCRSGSSNERQRGEATASSVRDFGENRRERFVHRTREYRIRPSETETLRTLGNFRVVRDEDIADGVHGGREQLSKADLLALRQQGLVSSVSFQELGGAPVRVHALTQPGHRLVCAISDSQQRFHWGIAKPSEVLHDSLLYRAYLREEEGIHRDGGEVRKVVLEVELKAEHYRRINSAGAKYDSVQRESAQELGLSIIEGRVVVPDLRIEYQDVRGDRGRVDVEVATANYRDRHFSAKVAAGFRVYTSGGGLGVSSGHPLRGNPFPRENRGLLSL